MKKIHWTDLKVVLNSLKNMRKKIDIITIINNNKKSNKHDRNTLHTCHTCHIITTINQLNDIIQANCNSLSLSEVGTIAMIL